ncbi:MAG TPA: aminopeptidase, partial [Clostridiales bacterium]|nr:aminopeptidase [Clostridiales bacterium]
SKLILEKNNVLTVEPGLYIPDWGGIRIEDTVLVTEEGYELLTKSSRELIV